MGYIEATKRDMRIEKELIAAYSERIDELPEGHLASKTICGHTYYYLVRPGSKKQEYIGRGDKAIVEDLRERRYAEKALRILTKNVQVQERLLRAYCSYSPQVIDELLPKTYRSENILSALKRQSSIDDHKNRETSFRRDERIHRTTFGLMVRSKSEAMIAELLHSRGVKFCYEEPLQLVDEYGRAVVRYPDFTVRSDDGSAVYWEHLGLLMDEGYREAAWRKLELYYCNGIFPGSNLVITCDSGTGALDVAGISRIVDSLAPV